MLCARYVTDRVGVMAAAAISAAVARCVRWTAATPRAGWPESGGTGGSSGVVAGPGLTGLTGLTGLLVGG
jgi:hypothetical protein